MRFETHNNSDASSTGTYLQGYMSCGYKDIVRIFGEPEGCDGYKVDAHWTIRFSDGEIATVYNWKNGRKAPFSSVKSSSNIVAPRLVI